MNLKPPVRNTASRPPARNVVEATSGLWRDGKRLVVQAGNCKFPPRCIKTGEVTEVTFYDINKPSLPRHPAVKTFFVLGLILLAASAGGYHGRVLVPVFGSTEPRPVNVGIANSWLARWQRHGLIGSLLIFGGGLMGILGTVAYVMVALQGYKYEKVANYTCLPFAVAGLIIPIVGVVYLFFTQGTLLRQTWAKGAFIWYAGAHSDFLSVLPEWDKAILERTV